MGGAKESQRAIVYERFLKSCENQRFSNPFKRTGVRGSGGGGGAS